ncbi:MAG TPA: hypothetical protein VIM21_11700 [Gemmatimonadaceae bacterium]
MRRHALYGFGFALLACAQNVRVASPASRPLTSVQLYLFNRSGQTADLKIALDDSVLYYAQVRTAVTPSEISGGRLVQRAPGKYRVILNDFTHAQQITRDVPVAESVVYIVVTTREAGSEMNVSTTRPF